MNFPVRAHGFKKEEGFVEWKTKKIFGIFLFRK
jgi:hypothetical protein